MFENLFSKFQSSKPVIITNNQLFQDSIILARKLKEYNPDILAPVMIGGLIPGAIIAKELDIEDIRPISIDRIGDTRPISYQIQGLGNIRGKILVIIEDDLRSGIGPNEAKKFFERNGAKVIIASVYIRSQTTGCDVYAKQYPNLRFVWKTQKGGNKIRK